jgi:hypothetical protein
MSPQEVPDVARHTIYIFDPRDFFTRYMTVLPIYKFREGARVGFLLPARLAYLLFGAVPGFFATRYFFALVAIVPTYLLLRRLYGSAAGVLGILILMSSPVIITAWGTDYPDCAAVSYLAGGLACLAMPSCGRRRGVWLALAGTLLTMAVASHGSALPLSAASVVAYGLVTFFRDRRRLLVDAAVLAGAAAVCIGLLVAGDALELGRTDFISVTWASAKYLQSPVPIKLWHAKGFAWATYCTYLLALPAAVAAWAVVFLRHRIPTAQLIVGAVCTAQLAAASYLQFFGNLWILQPHFSSSPLWGATCITVAITLAELARPLFTSRLLRWLPAVIALGVPLLYEQIYKHRDYVPGFRWWPFGVTLLLVIVAVAWLGTTLSRLSASRVSVASWSGVSPNSSSDTADVTKTHPTTDLDAARDKGSDQRALPDPHWRANRTPIWLAGSIGLVLLVMLGGGLVLTVAPIAPHTNVQLANAPTQYSAALGGNVYQGIHIYQVESQLPSFVGNATYPNEQLMIWHPHAQYTPLEDYTGLYYDGPNEIPGFPRLNPSTRSMLEARRPTEILLMSTTGAGFAVAYHALAAFGPVRDRIGVLRSGRVHIHLWLLTLREFERKR